MKQSQSRKDAMTLVHRSYLGEEIIDVEGRWQILVRFPGPPLIPLFHDTQKFAVVGWVKVERRMQGQPATVLDKLFRRSFEQRHVFSQFQSPPPNFKLVFSPPPQTLFESPPPPAHLFDSLQFPTRSTVKVREEPVSRLIFARFLLKLTLFGSQGFQKTLVISDKVKEGQ